MLPMHKNIRLLGWFNFLLDFRLYAPIAILYYAQVSGSYALGMSVFSVAMLTSALLELPTGLFSDMIGRRKTIAFGACASALSVLCYAVGGTYLMLVVGAAFEGLARSLFSGNNDALLHDTLAESDQQTAYQTYLGRVSAMYQFALAGSAVLGSIIAAFSFPVTFWLSVLPQIAGIVISLRLVEPAVHSARQGNIYHHLREAVRNTIQNPRLMALNVASVLSFAIGEASFQFRVAFFESLWPVWAIGIARMIANIGAAISFYLSGRIIKRFGEFQLLIAGIGLSELVNLFSLLIPTVLSPALMGATSIFFGVNTVSVNGLMQREFTSEQRATMGSLNAFAGNLGFAVFSFALGALADHVGVANALIVTTLLAFVPLWFYRQAFRHEPALAVS